MTCSSVYLYTSASSPLYAAAISADLPLPEVLNSPVMWCSQSATSFLDLRLILYSMGVLQMVLVPPDGLPRIGLRFIRFWIGCAVSWYVWFMAYAIASLASLGNPLSYVAVQLSIPLVSLGYPYKPCSKSWVRKALYEVESSFALCRIEIRRALMSSFKCLVALCHFCSQNWACCSRNAFGLCLYVPAVSVWTDKNSLSSLDI